MSPSNRFQGGHSITRFAYDKATTALLLIDPYNDFIFEGADYSQERMHAALDVNIPSYASAIVTTKEVVESISSL